MPCIELLFYKMCLMEHFPEAVVGARVASDGKYRPAFLKYRAACFAEQHFPFWVKPF